MKVQQIEDTYIILPESNVLEELPVGYYTLIDEDNPRVKAISYPHLPAKLYGEVNRNVEIIYNSFQSTSKNLGVLLSGLKGAGKSLTCTVLAKKLGIPTISVTGGFSLNKLTEYSNSLEQRVIFILDEFDKYYEAEEQNDILTLLDGVYSSNKLFVLIVNKVNLSEFLVNRLGRIKFHFRYNHCSEEIVEEILNDNLKNKHHKDDLLEVLNIIGSITPDNLLNFIAEVDKLDVPPRSLANILNFVPESATYLYNIVYKGTRGTGHIHRHPLLYKELTVWYESVNSMDGKMQYTTAEFKIDSCRYWRKDDVLNIEDPEGNAISFVKQTPYLFEFKGE
jgi:hypothetical protein